MDFCRVINSLKARRKGWSKGRTVDLTNDMAMIRVYDIKQKDWEVVQDQEPKSFLKKLFGQ